MRAAGVGLAEAFCKRHVELKARHGSALAPSYRAAELAPYLKIARPWIRQRVKAGDLLCLAAIDALRELLDGSGRADPAMNLRRRPAADRARVAFARLRDAGVKPERLLAIHLAMAAILQDDRDSHRVNEFALVQVAKAAHRLASGTHRKWEVPLQDGTTAPLAMHVYPRSSGQVLRLIGTAIDEIAAPVTYRDRDTVRELKAEAFGPHPSRLPGWLPRWQRKRQGML